MTELPGNTPITPEELGGLIPSLATQHELNEWERENILVARAWALGKKQIKRADPFAEAYLRELHRRMFSDTWKWAGSYRRSARNLGVSAHEIRDRLATLLGDARYWVEHQTYSADEIAVRCHHQLVLVHPFPNGNGRHARLYADALAVHLGRPEFSWGRETMIAPGPTRAAYLQALRCADGHDLEPLLRFSRS